MGKCNTGQWQLPLLVQEAYVADALTAQILFSLLTLLDYPPDVWHHQ